jgi:2-polyprenyl-3-methyl-5-hydroxy-6-metoxy-1,4-benzoquinol methylase
VSKQKDIAGEDYWSEEWNSAFERKGEDERDRGWRNHVTLQFDALFTRFLPQAKTPGRPLHVTEIGCARSRWLPYFARRFGATVGGLDYSVLGCQQAREVLSSAGLTGEIVHGDLFAPPAELVGTSDVVLSWGLVEHFEDTANVLGALERFVRPGGLLVTVIPNMTGSVGRVQRWLNERIFKLHVLIDREQLAAAFRGRNGDTLFNDYYVACNYWTVNPGKAPDARTSLVPRLAFRALTLLTVATWMIERTFRTRLPATRRFSPYIVNIRRVGASEHSVTTP